MRSYREDDFLAVEYHLEEVVKATLKFNLPDDQGNFVLASHASELAIDISTLREQTRTWLKHGHEFKTPGEAIEACREILSDSFAILDQAG